jgi:hypothetical protein
MRIIYLFIKHVHEMVNTISIIIDDVKLKTIYSV